MIDEARRLAELAPKIMNAFHDLGRQHPEKEKLSMRQFQALIILHANETLTVSQLCEKLSLAPSTGTELVNRMIALDYIKKGQEKKDKRQVKLYVAPKGFDLLKERQRMLANMFSKFIAPFEAKDQQVFVRCFEKIWEIIAKYHTTSK